MDARSTAAARAVHLVVCQANDAAIAENTRLRGEIARAMAAIERGDRVLALRQLSVALNQEPVVVVPLVRGRGPYTCALCGARKRAIWQMPATGRWALLPAVQRELCRPCYRLQPQN